MSDQNIFEKLGLCKKPVILAPLAGVSDSPFRQVCYKNGADLCYVEMISAAALVHDNYRTKQMLYRHSSETVLGVQVTSRTAEEMGQAVEILNPYGFSTLDINMGCPVKKVVKTGCGSAILQDVNRVYETTLAAVKACNVPVSVKIRLGWDHNTRNYLEVVDAIERAGAKWVTVHGRTRNDDYSVPVDLEAIGEIKKQSKLPIIGNGNLFSLDHASHMNSVSQVDGFMVSRGALGNPWVFLQLKTKELSLSLVDWYETVCLHLKLQEMVYEGRPSAMLIMRKHLLWYLKGWRDVRAVRDKVVNLNTFEEAYALLADFYSELTKEDKNPRELIRDICHNQEGNETLYHWNPSPQIRELDGNDAMDQGL